MPPGCGAEAMAAVDGGGDVYENEAELRASFVSEVDELRRLLQKQHFEADDTAHDRIAAIVRQQPHHTAHATLDAPHAATPYKPPLRTLTHTLTHSLTHLPTRSALWSVRSSVPLPFRPFVPCVVSCAVPAAVSWTVTRSSASCWILTWSRSCRLCSL